MSSMRCCSSVMCGGILKPHAFELTLWMHWGNWFLNSQFDCAFDRFLCICVASIHSVFSTLQDFFVLSVRKWCNVIVGQPMWFTRQTLTRHTNIIRIGICSQVLYRFQALAFFLLDRRSRSFNARQQVVEASTNLTLDNCIQRLVMLWVIVLVE